MKLLVSFVIVGLVSQSLATFCPSSVKCPAEDPDVVVQFPNPDDCHSFCKCYNGDAYLVPCPGDLRYNAKLEVCDYPQNVKCHSKLQTNAAVECPKDMEDQCPKKDKYYPVYIPFKDNPHCYCACSGGLAWKQCCPSDLVFNTDEQRCDRHTVSRLGGGQQCDRSVWSQCPDVDPSPPKYLPNPYDCHSFCECNGGIAWYQHCPSNLVFDPTKNVCDDYPCHSSVARGVQHVRVRGGLTCPYSVSDRCPEYDGQRPTYFPYPGDCHRFCECSNNVAYAQDCPVGTVYNSDIEACGFGECYNPSE